MKKNLQKTKTFVNLSVATKCLALRLAIPSQRRANYIRRRTRCRAASVSPLRATPNLRNPSFRKLRFLTRTS